MGLLMKNSKTTNPFELLEEDKEKARAKQVAFQVSMVLRRLIVEQGAEKSAALIGVGKSRISQLVTRGGSGVTIDFMISALLKMGGNVETELELDDKDPSITITMSLR